MRKDKNNEKTISKRERLTQTPVPKLIITLAIPTIISMLVTGFYNMADTFFVGKISTQATAAVGLVFPVMAIIQAFGFFFGQGSGTYLSRMLGAGNTREANEMAITGFITSLAAGVICAAVGNIFAEPLAYAIGASRYHHGGHNVVHEDHLDGRTIYDGAVRTQQSAQVSG